MHEQTQISWIYDYTKEIWEHFYKNSFGDNPLSKSTTRLKNYNLPYKLKHKISYQKLDIFYK